MDGRGDPASCTGKVTRQATVRDHQFRSANHLAALFRLVDQAGTRWIRNAASSRPDSQRWCELIGQVVRHKELGAGTGAEPKHAAFRQAARSAKLWITDCVAVVIVNEPRATPDGDRATIPGKPPAAILMTRRVAHIGAVDQPAWW